MRENGGRVQIFSALHVSGEQLALVSGIAAILRYPLPDIEATVGAADADDSDSDTDSDSDGDTDAQAGAGGERRPDDNIFDLCAMGESKS